MKILVIGDTGTLGGRVAWRPTGKGHQVQVPVHDRTMKAPARGPARTGRRSNDHPYPALHRPVELTQLFRKPLYKAPRATDADAPGSSETLPLNPEEAMKMDNTAYRSAAGVALAAEPAVLCTPSTIMYNAAMYIRMSSLAWRVRSWASTRT